jgi:hypothetical protein
MTCAFRPTARINPAVASIIALNNARLSRWDSICCAPQDLRSAPCLALGPLPPRNPDLPFHYLSSTFTSPALA